MLRLPFLQRGVMLVVLLAPMATGAQVVESMVVNEETMPLGRPAEQAEQTPIGERAGSGVGVVRTIGALGIVIGLAMAAWVGVRLIARANGGLSSMLGPGGRAPSGLLEVLGRYPVGRGQTLVLLRVDRRVLLLSQASGGRLGMSSTFTTLSEITDAEEVASILLKTRDDSSREASTRFSALLGRADQAYDPPFEMEGRDIPVVDLTGGNDGPRAVVASIRRRMGSRHQARGGVA